MEEGVTPGRARHELEQAAHAVRRQVRRDGNVHPDTESWFARALRAYMEVCAALRGQSAELHPQDAAMRRLARRVFRMEDEQHRATWGLRGRGFEKAVEERRARGAEERRRRFEQRVGDDR